jgi:hypothetical protein
MPRSASAGPWAGGRFGPRRRVRLRKEVGLIPAINGRPVISRADMAARGVPRTTGHPDPGPGDADDNARPAADQDPVTDPDPPACAPHGIPPA